MYRVHLDHFNLDSDEDYMSDVLSQIYKTLSECAVSFGFKLIAVVHLLSV